jgi:hypothetical protein
MRSACPLALVAVAGWLAGCSSVFPKDPDQGKLAQGCQIVKCLCTPISVTLFTFERPAKPTEVLWRQDGTAYCPEGMQLETRDKPSIYDRPLY